MFSKIICPVDFSEAATNAVEYAAKVAQELSLELFLINVKPLLYNDLIGGNADLLREITLDAKEQLNTICLNTKASLHISCNSEVVVTSQRVEKIISLAAKEKSIIIMGTNGTDSLYQYFFGTQTFNVIKRVKCPVLVVPDNVLYQPIKELVYVWGYEETSKIYLEQIVRLAELFKASIQFLYINKNNTTASAISNAALEVTGLLMNKKNIQYSFEQIKAEDIVEATNQYMCKKENCVLVISIFQSGIMRNIFKKNKVKTISAQTSYPIIFIHDDQTNNTASQQ